MRKFVLSLSLFLYVLVGKAMPFIQDSKRWRISYCNYFFKEQRYQPSQEDRLTIKYKEIVGYQEYVILQLDHLTIDSNTHGWEKNSAISSYHHGEYDDDRFYIHIREDNGRVYILKDDYLAFCNSKYGLTPDISSMQEKGENDVLLYDFNLKVGDTYPFPGHVTVVETGNITFDNSSYPYQLLSNSLLIIESVGCVNSFGGIIAYQSVPEIRIFDRFATFLNFVIVEEDDKEIFQYLNVVNEDMLLNISDNTLNNHPKTNSIHDLQGRRLNGAPHKGIYIKNGKKYVVR